MLKDRALRHEPNWPIRRRQGDPAIERGLHDTDGNCHRTFFSQLEGDIKSSTGADRRIPDGLPPGCACRICGYARI